VWADGFFGFFHGAVEIGAGVEEDEGEFRMKDGACGVGVAEYVEVPALL